MSRFLRKTLRLPVKKVKPPKIDSTGTWPIGEDQPITLEKSPFEKEKTQCVLCKLNVQPDYKNVRLLSQFQSVYTGRIYGKHITGLCEAKQKKVEHEILKAQNAGLMGYYLKDPKYTHDPKMFDPDRPFRPNKL